LSYRDLSRFGLPDLMGTRERRLGLGENLCVLLLAAEYTAESLRFTIRLDELEFGRSSHGWEARSGEFKVGSRERWMNGDCPKCFQVYEVVDI